MALALILVPKNIGNVSEKDTNTTELFSWILCVLRSFNPSLSNISIFREFCCPGNPVSCWLIHCFCVRWWLGNQPRSMLAGSGLVAALPGWKLSSDNINLAQIEKEWASLRRRLECLSHIKTNIPGLGHFSWELSSDRISKTLILQKVIKLGCCSYNTKGLLKLSDWVSKLSDQKMFLFGEYSLYLVCYRMCTWV